MNSSELPIYKTLYPLIPLMFSTVKNMNRIERILIGEKMFAECVKLSEYILKANTLLNDPDGRLNILLRFRTHYESLRMLIRVAAEVRAISNGAIAMYTKRLDSVGKQLNSWIEYTRKIRDKIKEENETISK